MQRKRTATAWFARAALLIYLVGLLVLATRGADGTAPARVSLFHAHSLRELADALVDAALDGLLGAARFVPLGLLLPLSLPRVECRLGRLVLVALPSVVLGTLMAGAIIGLELGYPWQRPGSLDLLLPAAGVVFGVWVGMTWLRGARALAWMIPKIALLLVALGGAGAALLALGTEPSPRDLTVRPVTSAEKRELVALFRKAGKRREGQSETRELSLTQRHIDALVAWGLSLGSSDRKAAVRLDRGRAALDVSVGVPLPVGSGGKRYLNGSAGLRGGVRSGRADFRLEAISLGRLRAPSLLLELVSPVIVGAIVHDRRMRPLLETIQELELSPERVAVRYTGVELPREVLPRLVAEAGTSEEVRAATRAQLLHLAEIAAGLPSGPARFGACLETAFAFARDRSVAGDPIVENKGALLALGILLGHDRLSLFVGPVASERAIEKTQASLGTVTLRGRADWTRHFLLSAGLAALSTRAVSDTAGVLKEELDAEGGSGFSFADLLADRAGTTLARKATSSPGSARDVQSRFSRGLGVDDVFPEASDLPEGIPDAELRSRYGGVGGSAYQRVVADIERRIARCAAYR